MLVTNNSEVWERAWSFKDHGKNYSAAYQREPAPGFRWLHESFGTNWRMTEVQAAVGRVALKKLARWVRVRRANAAILTEGFSDLKGLRVALPPDNLYHAYYKYYAFVRPERLRAGWNRDRIMNALAEKGVPCLSGSCSEIYLEKSFPAEWKPGSRLPIAKELGETSLMFLVHPTLTAGYMHYAADAARAVMSEATAQPKILAGR